LTLSARILNSEFSRIVTKILITLIEYILKPCLIISCSFLPEKSTEQKGSPLAQSLFCPVPKTGKAFRPGSAVEPGQHSSAMSLQNAFVLNEASTPIIYYVRRFLRVRFLHASQLPPQTS
jgi:hypothetical protein